MTVATHQGSESRRRPKEWSVVEPRSTKVKRKRLQSSKRGSQKAKRRINFLQARERSLNLMRPLRSLSNRKEPRQSRLRSLRREQWDHPNKRGLSHLRREEKMNSRWWSYLSNVIPQFSKPKDLKTNLQQRDLGLPESPKKWRKRWWMMNHRSWMMKLAI